MNVEQPSVSESFDMLVGLVAAVKAPSRHPTRQRGAQAAQAEQHHRRPRFLRPGCGYRARVRPRTLEALARSAIGSEPGARAPGREHWRELLFAAALDARQTQSTVFEDIADLVYREDDDSLVIVDFKTNIGLSAEQMDAYWHQLSTYADFIHRATCQTVSELALVFCRSDPAQAFPRVAV
ncbi:PD-(D/E)XK nuclease family protein [Cryobacterium serini]|uniref:PD-(D/E)XK endonuclease-like domain-containing protein n=1 Tax=Cryobacterium serini TaxID=1259201 RepID=A0A4R9BUB2_9MICO|nr:PD-(D/E)XK nuclease family protein [Cryobacterium serini]TFD91223.1 hypothetical protein E3T51_00455 [Cryobacterium serini]